VLSWPKESIEKCRSCFAAEQPRVTRGGGLKRTPFYAAHRTLLRLPQRPRRVDARRAPGERSPESCGCAAYLISMSTLASGPGGTMTYAKRPTPIDAPINELPASGIPHSRNRPCASVNVMAAGTSLIGS
jgi:hypothetical protein